MVPEKRRDTLSPIAPNIEPLELGDDGVIAVLLDASALRDLDEITCDCNSLLALFQRL